EVIKRIEEIPSPHSAAEVDRIIWGGTSTGSFFVKSAYEKLQESSWNPKEVQWLLTDMERVRRGLGHSTTCGVCGYIFEDVLHAIKDCPIVRNIWNHLAPVERHDRLESCSVLDADLWGILDGLVLLIDQGYDNMLIHTDCLEAVKAIQESPSNGSNSTLDADSLVKLVYDRNHGLRLFEAFCWGK
ncbi:hypothetical protein Gotri_004724, partial [Gossypium trilobum]|nr:hypothetical protein [Gossypium trilobum]